MRSMLRGVGIQRHALIVLVILAGLLLAFSGCQGLPWNVANCAITPTPPSDLSIVPPAPEPPPAALCGFSLTVSGPTSGANVNAPFPLVAAAMPPDPIYTVRVYVDGQAVLYTPKTTINQLIWMANGQHTLEVVAEDTTGHIATASIQLNVIGQEPGALNIQNQNSWASCSALIVNSTCAAGLGTATSTLTLNQTTTGTTTTTSVLPRKIPKDTGIQDTVSANLWWDRAGRIPTARWVSRSPTAKCGTAILLEY